MTRLTHRALLLLTLAIYVTWQQGCIQKRDVVDPDVRPVSAGSLIVMTVEEDSAARSVELGQLMGDKGYWDGLESKGHKVYHREEKQAQKYRDDWKSVGLPCVLLWDRGTKKFLGAESLKSDASEPDVDKLIGKYVKP